MQAQLEAPTGAVRRPRSLWRNRDYLLLWGGQAISATGSQVSHLALPLLILAETGSPAQAGLLGALRGLSYLLFGLPAGALVDRWNRRWVMILSDIIRALAFASIPLAMLTGHLTAVQLYAVSFIEGTLFIFFGLAESASLPRVVPPEQLPTAVSQYQATEAASSLAGPPLGGALFSLGRALPFLADALTYTVSVVSLLFVRARLQAEQAAERRTIRAEIGEGLRWIVRRPVMLVLMWLNGGINLVYGGWTILLIALAQEQGAGSTAIGLIFAAGGAGTILGSIVTPRMQRRCSVGVLVVGVTWVFALTWPPYALAVDPLTLGIANAIGFFFLPIGFATQYAYRLLLLPDALQGRVNSVFRVAGFGGQSLGLILTGLLIEAYGPRPTVWITFVPAIILALLPTLSPAMRGIGRLADVGKQNNGGKATGNEGQGGE